MKKSLTIGFFDGVHLGHQALLRKLAQFPNPTILTFSNHPLDIIHPPAPKLILNLEEKVQLLKNYAKEVIVLPFTQEFASISYDELLDRFDLSHLIFGIGSVFGKDRKGDELHIRKYAQKKEIFVEYFPKILFENEPISSSRIRKALEDKNLNLAHQLLGRLP